jgi:hypothetical protein
MIRRREFLTLLGGGAAGWPLAARAQQRDRTRRIGVFMNLPADDSRAQARVGSFHQGLQQLGWVIDRNVSIDYRWGLGDADQNRRFASDLVAVNPDVILQLAARSTLCASQPGRFRSYLLASSIPLAEALLQIWLVQAAMPPALLVSNSA